ncbi:uncharacterized protein LOC131463996 [Solea solea]|uniref:uncharacterized protein LOC131463996 n=1 Tax=Solea solea TaxID=90069 RepID=UPI00272BCD1A|nr:uncharacterized protein LOC131463996 [Solea solea]
MMFPRLCLALLALSSLAAASDPGCEELVKPLEDRSKISGKWIFHVGGADTEEYLKNLKYFHSSWIDIPTVLSDNMTIRFADRHEEKCLYGHANFSNEGNNTKLTFHFNSTSHDHVGMLLVSCADCLLWIENTESKKNGEINMGRQFYLFTKSGDLAESDLAFFMKQAACLNVLPDFYFAETKDLCPDEKEAAASKETTQEQ